MLRIERLLGRIKTRTAQRFSSEAARFRLAVASGFVIVAVGVLIVGFGARSGIADTIWGLDLFGGQSSFFGQSTEPQQPQQQSYGAFQPRHRHVARRRAGETTLAFTSGTRHADTDHDDAMQLGRQSMCVRLCDGFSFPIGAYHGEQDKTAHEATCHSECPGAETALYVMPSGGETMDEAVRVDTGQTYSALPDAFHYTTVLSETCSCHAKSGSRIKSLLHDFTLRRGDAVMTGIGFKVFHGGAHYPFNRNDFIALSRSRDVHERDRANLNGIERASLINPTINLADTAIQPKPTARSASKTIAKPQRQASR
jgi:hypothetical protein